MICPNCGKENKNSDKFCGFCGTSLLQEKPKSKSEFKKKYIWIVIAAILLLCVILLAIFLESCDNAGKRYQNFIENGERYLEELEYEKAEIAFLDAIKIEPKKVKPYIQLADIYIAQDKYEDAKNILEQAEDILAQLQEENLERYEEEQKFEEEIEDKKEEMKDDLKPDEVPEENEDTYIWAVKPTIEADDIFYLADYPDKEHPVNMLSEQANNSKAVIQKGDCYGIINLDGKMLAEIEYKEVANFGEHYMLIRKEPIYIEEFEQKWNLFWLDKDDHINADVGNGSLETVNYYYSNGTRRKSGSLLESNLPSEAIPVQEIETSKYALEKNGQLLTDFIYDECGSESNGLFAVARDGKWGYMNEKKEMIIPMEYDASWKQYAIFDNGSRRSTSDEMKDFCYAASDGYVVLCKDDKWELRDILGKEIISKDVFEAIRPVFEGKCWVKKNGKWGVIQVGESNL